MATIPPEKYRTLEKQYPELFTALEALGENVKKVGPIEEKNAQLIQLAAAAASRSEGAVHSHTRRAIDAGASREEIHHALLLLISTIGFPHAMAALSWAGDVLEESK
jgi:4-carboxymuconolactone decarboxylase